MSNKAQKPKNIVLLVTDQERYPPCYETPEVKAYRHNHFKTRTWLAEHGVQFHNHYIASTACCPSRASLFTGHYPPTHGVTQTYGLAKEPDDVIWLQPNSVPTMADYFAANGYDCIYKGKWHISHEDLHCPITRESLQVLDSSGNVLSANVKEYLSANPLKKFGFDGWIGPEPHGPNYLNSGWYCDPLYAQQAVNFLEQRDAEHKANSHDSRPFLLVVSLVNPHDIVFFELGWRMFGLPYPPAEVPTVPPSPTDEEDLRSQQKPRVQYDYGQKYSTFFFRQTNEPEFRRFYYWLHAKVDEQLGLVLDKLRQCSFFEDTVVVWTADHGEMLGSHGHLYQKWHAAYEEMLHVPLVVSNLRSSDGQEVHGEDSSLLTSHVDLIPTLLSLVGANYEETLKKLSDAKASRAVFPLLGKDFSSRLLAGEFSSPVAEEQVVYFLTEDEISKGSRQEKLMSRRLPFLKYFFDMNYEEVKGPGHVETVVLTTKGGDKWKMSRYYEDLEVDDVNEDWELYSLALDPLEECNLMSQQGLELLEKKNPGRITRANIEEMKKKLKGHLVARRRKMLDSKQLNEGVVPAFRARKAAKEYTQKVVSHPWYGRIALAAVGGVALYAVWKWKQQQQTA